MNAINSRMEVHSFLSLCMVIICSMQFTSPRIITILLSKFSSVYIESLPFQNH